MRIRALILFCLMPLSGCGLANLDDARALPPNVTGNWQIQSASGVSTTGLPNAGLLLLGQLTSSGGVVTGTFRLANLSLPNSCGAPLQQIVSLTGSADSGRNLTLTSAAFSGSVLTMQLTIPLIETSFGSGTIAITGGSCPFASSSAIAAQVASVTGTYAGTVTASTTLASPSPITSGKLTLTVAQSTTANSDGQFPIAGTIAFAGGSCTTSIAATGTISGSELNFGTGVIPPINVIGDQIFAAVQPTATELDGVSAVYGFGPCGTSLTTTGEYTGTLTKQ